MKGRTVSVAFFLLISVLLTEYSRGEEFRVTDAAQLRDALAEAGSNGEDDTINVAQGTYTGNFAFVSNEGARITLLGGFSTDFSVRDIDPANTILDGGGTGRVVSIKNTGSWGNGEGEIYVEGFTIQNGDSPGDGGGILAESYSSWIAGTIVIRRNRIVENSASDFGGGIYAASYSDANSAGSVTIAHNTIAGNSAQEGGGIRVWTAHEGQYARREKGVRISEKRSGAGRSGRLFEGGSGEGEISIIGNIIKKNIGGGLAASTDGELEAGLISIVRNRVIENTGIGIRAGTFAGTIDVSANFVSGNISNREGGGIYARSYNEYTGGTMSFVNNIISRNFASKGGGIYASTDGMGQAGTLSLINNTISGNMSSDSGGGVCLARLAGSVLNLYNNIIWGNSSPTGGDIKLTIIEPAAQEWGISNGFNNDFTSLDGFWTNSGGNIDSDPLFRDPESGDLHLKFTSPCIDQGTNSAPGLPSSDWDGDPRKLDGNGDGVVLVDIGADEYVRVDLFDLTISSSEGGTTVPPPGTYTFEEGTRVSVEAVPGVSYSFSQWTGDVSGRDNPLYLTMSANKSIHALFLRIIYAPLNLTGRKVLNRSLSQAEYINVLDWQAHPANVNIAKYRIYQLEGGNEDLLAELNADTLQFQHRRVGKDHQNTYAVCAVTVEGREGIPASISFR